MPVMDEFGHHEVTHVKTVIHDMWHDYIAQHPAVTNCPDIKDELDQVNKALFEFESKWLTYVDEKFK